MFLKNHAASMAPVAEKAQQLPQPPWFLTGVTAPFCSQSIEPGGAAAATALVGGRSPPPRSAGACGGRAT